MDDPVGDSGRDASPRHPGAPRWVKVLVVVAALVLLVVLILLLTGTNHGPGRHLDGGQPTVPEHSGSHP